MWNLHVNMLGALVSALTTVATCQGSAPYSGGDACAPAGTRENTASTWHGHAKRLSLHATGAVHVHAASSGEIEVRAVPHHGHRAPDAPFVLLALERGRGVTLCVAPAGSDEDEASCPSGARDWPDHRAPVIDLEVSVPEDTHVLATGTAT